MSSYPEAYKKFRASTKAAVEFHDPNWTNSAITRERIKRLNAARDELRAARPSGDTTAAVDPAQRAAVFEQLRPLTADAVAVTGNEWAKAKALLDSGRNLQRLIETSDLHRLAAILDRLPTELAIQSSQPEDAIAEVESLVFARLAELGDKQAVAYVEAERAADYENAWGRVIDETLTGEPTVGALTALYNASPEDHEATISEEQGMGETDIAFKVQQLDRIAASEGGGAVANH